VTSRTCDIQENEKRHEMDQQVERRRRQREQQATRRARSGDIPRDSSRPVLCSHGRPKVCCLYVYASVCLVRISSETAGRIWLKFYTGRTYVHSRTLCLAFWWRSSRDPVSGVENVVVLSSVDTGDEVEFNTVDFVESRLLPRNLQQSAIKSTVVVYVQLCC